jgi:SAM-dependent methyltransferase
MAGGATAISGEVMLASIRTAHRIVNLPQIKRFLVSRRFIVKAYFDYRHLRANTFRPPPERKREKIDRALALIDGFRSANALEVGCGEGRWSRRVAEHAERLTAVDISGNAIRRARRLNRDQPRISFAVMDFLTTDLPCASFDLIFCSEVLYYFDLDQLATVNARLADLLSPDGRLLLVHDRSVKDDGKGLELKEFGARTIHDAVIRRAELEVLADLQEDTYRITLLRRLPFLTSPSDTPRRLPAEALHADQAVRRNEPAAGVAVASVQPSRT